MLDCFSRNQLDDSLFGNHDWIDENLESQSVEERLSKVRVRDFNMIERLKTWSSFEMISHRFDPRDGINEPNSERLSVHDQRSLTETEINQHLESLRASHDDLFPRDAVEALQRHAKQVKEQLLAEVHAGMERGGTESARVNNAPFLAMAILISQDVSIPAQLLLDILDLPNDQKMDLFGDALQSAVVFALAQNLQGDTSPIDQRIADPKLTDVERAGFVDFYLWSAWNNFLLRAEAIEKIISLIQSKPQRAILLSVNLIEALCLLSACEQRDLVDQWFAAGNEGQRFHSTEQALAMLDNPQRGTQFMDEEAYEYRSAMKIIERSTMFKKQALYPERTDKTPDSSNQYGTTATRVTAQETIRHSAAKPERNSACPCGSGKKYKKCCLRK